MVNNENTSPNNDDKELESKINNEILAERMKENLKLAQDALKNAEEIVKKEIDKSDK